MNLREQLRIDPAAVTHAIVAQLRRQVGEELRRAGLVVAMSGGLDSSVCAALAARAVGAERVLGVALPERECDPQSVALASACAAQFGIHFVVEDITATLEACGCYARRDAAIARATPYGPGWRCKLITDGGGNSARLPVGALVVESPDGTVRRVRLPAAEFRDIVAATNCKQRVRAMLAYYHADRLHYAVVGTPNRLEYELGFFVKGGDGLADVKPIAHLYKSQVRQLAEFLGVPEAIRGRTPTTDTYPLSQTQEEFYFSVPLDQMDALLLACNEEHDPQAIAGDLGLTPTEVSRAYRDIGQKRATAALLHRSPLTVAGEPD